MNVVAPVRGHRRQRPPQGGLPLPHRPRQLHRRHQPAGPGSTPMSCAARTPMRNIKTIDTAAAKARRAWSPSSPAPTWPPTDIGGLPCGWQVNNKDGTPMAEPPHPALAHGKVRHVGDPVAVVIAETREQARDAAEPIVVDYEVLPAVADLADAMKPGAAAVLGRGAEQHLLRLAHRRQGGDSTPPSRKAAHVVALDMVNNRLIAERDGAARGARRVRHGDGRLHAATPPARIPHVIRLLMGAFVLHIPEQQAARRGARCRRRLRLEDLPLCRGSDRHLGRRQARPAGEVDRRAHARSSCPTRMAATT